MIILSLIIYLVATVTWYYSEVRFLKCMDANEVGEGIKWASLSLLGPPLFMLSTYWMWKEKAAWWAVQFPYWFMSIGVSYFLFRQVLCTRMGWREIVSAVLILIVALLMGTE